MDKRVPTSIVVSHWVWLAAATLIISLGGAIARIAWQRWSDRLGKLLRLFAGRWQLAIPLIGFSLTAALLDTHWQVASWIDVWQWPGGLPDEISTAAKRAELYQTIFLNTAIAVGIGWVVLRCAWTAAPRSQKVLIGAQIILALAAVAILPVAYGRLMLPFSYPVITGLQSQQGETLLVLGESANSWIVWNSTRRQTQVVPKSAIAPVSIGPRQSVVK